MIKSRKEMHEYIRKDMERNFVYGGGQVHGLKYY